MNKIFKKMLVTVVCIGAAASALRTPAQSFYSSSFLNGQDLAVNDKTTNSFGSTNLVYVRQNSIFGPAYSTLSTNLTYTNTSGVIFTNWQQPQVTNGSGIQDVGLWVDRDGTTPSSLNISVHWYEPVPNAGNTNVISLQFAGVPFGTGPLYPAATDVDHQFQFRFRETTNADSIITTNITTPAWLTGCAGVRLLNVICTNDNPAIAGSNGTIRSIRLNGFH